MAEYHREKRIEKVVQGIFAWGDSIDFGFRGVLKIGMEKEKKLNNNLVNAISSSVQYRSILNNSSRQNVDNLLVSVVKSII